MREELGSLISVLSLDEQIDLVALHWIGRDDGHAGDWQEIRRQADAHDEHTTGYLCGNPSSAITWKPDSMLSACLASTDRT
ncbi:DUF3775 domain-containing protein [Mesorhizobium sp.]|uniref:DUF3775 domain-containing protein n=1 Tax=Mesorhizobium sp. TaxID=1871066 RepID=UPI0025BBA41F|nr:DUF3775 domain-containing protein [Mesorhizobium sp.]